MLTKTGRRSGKIDSNRNQATNKPTTLSMNSVNTKFRLQNFYVWSTPDATKENGVSDVLKSLVLHVDNVLKNKNKI